MYSSVGNLLGEGKAKRAGVAANTSIVLAVMIASFWSAMLMIFRQSWAHMFNNDPGPLFHWYVLTSAEPGLQRL